MKHDLSLSRDPLDSQTVAWGPTLLPKAGPRICVAGGGFKVFLVCFAGSFLAFSRDISRFSVFFWFFEVFLWRITSLWVCLGPPTPKSRKALFFLFSGQQQAREAREIIVGAAQNRDEKAEQVEKTGGWSTCFSWYFDVFFFFVCFVFCTLL